MTSNIGADLIQSNFESLNEDNEDEVVGKATKDVYEVSKQTVRPEFFEPN